MLRLTAIAGIVAALVLLLAERRWPLRLRTAATLARVGVNLALAAGALVVAGAMRPLLQRWLSLASAQRLGLLPALRLPAALEAVLAFLLLDASFYWWHRANHRLPILWRFHNVHHVDPALDVTTALRFHFGEVALSVVFRVAQVTLFGLGAGSYWAYELCFQLSTLFHHSNLRLPIASERRLARVMVTPRMHGIHHSQVEAEASSNYGVVLPFWDRLHRTLRLNVPQRLLVLGVPAYARPGDNRLLSLLALPFRRQRDHWRREEGGAPERGPLPGAVDDLAE